MEQAFLIARALPKYYFISY